jgi:hypothetical protein
VTTPAPITISVNPMAARQQSGSVGPDGGRSRSVGGEPSPPSEPLAARLRLSVAALLPLSQAARASQVIRSEDGPPHHKLVAVHDA